MAYARAKSGTQRLTAETGEYVLTEFEWTELPDALAASVAGHVNIEVTHKKPKAAEPAAVEEPKAEKHEKQDKHERHDRG